MRLVTFDVLRLATFDDPKQHTFEASRVAALLERDGADVSDALAHCAWIDETKTSVVTSVRTGGGTFAIRRYRESSIARVEMAAEECEHEAAIRLAAAYEAAHHGQRRRGRVSWQGVGAGVDGVEAEERERGSDAIVVRPGRKERGGEREGEDCGSSGSVGRGGGGGGG
eukprot:206662-Pleurochrysis_carterae.AAC.1